MSYDILTFYHIFIQKYRQILNFIINCKKWKELRYLKIYFFFILLLINSFIVLYFIYSYIELYIFNSKQGSKLKLKNKENRGDFNN